MKIFITGGSGTLGSKLVSYLRSTTQYDVLAPTSTECNLLNYEGLHSVLTEYQPDYVLHLAAFVNTYGCENDIDKALDVNVVGTINLVKCCQLLQCKFVYISSEYVFSGETGQYTTTDRLDPINVYGKTKAAAEYIVSILPNHQIIRAPFVKQLHSSVFVDQYSSRDFVDNICAKLINNIVNNDDTIVHIASERQSLYDFYVSHGIQAQPIYLDSSKPTILPKDTSLINKSI